MGRENHRCSIGCDKPSRAHPDRSYAVGTNLFTQPIDHGDDRVLDDTRGGRAVRSLSAHERQHLTAPIDYSPGDLCATNVDADGPVSYTHLDVYKRQGQGDAEELDRQEYRLSLIHI